MRLMNGATIDGATVEVSLSKPIDKSAINRLIRGTPSPTSSLLSNAAAIMAAVSGVGSPTIVGQPPPVITIPFTNVAAIDATSAVAAAAAAAAQAVPTTGSGNTPPSSISIPASQFQSFQAQSLLTTVPNVQANQSSQSYMPAQYLPPTMGYAAGELLAASSSSSLLTQSPQSSSQSPSTTQQIQMNNNNNNKTTHRMSSSKATSSSRSAPGVYRYYFKGPMATVKKQASSQVRTQAVIKFFINYILFIFVLFQNKKEISYDLYSGINPVPVLPFQPFLNYSNKNSVQVFGNLLFFSTIKNPKIILEL